MNSDYAEELMRLGLTHIFEESKIHLVFLGAFLIISIILTLNGFEFKNRISYTIRRLTLTEKEYFLLQGLCCSLIYLIFMTVQIALVYLLSVYYFHTVPEMYHSNQTLFVTFYMNDFLHSLLPLHDTVRVVRNVLMIIALGFSSAYQSYSQRRGSKQSMFLVLAFMVVLCFKTSLGSFVGDTMIISGSVTALVIISTVMLKRGDGYAH